MNKSVENIFARQIKILRTQIFNKSQREFAKFLEIPQPTLSSYEAGKSSPTIEVVIDIAKKCNIPVDWLCGNTDTLPIKTLGDVAELIFALTEVAEFYPEFEVHDRVDIEDTSCKNKDLRNWVSFTFYHNEYRNNPELTLSLSICNLMTSIIKLHRELQSYEISYDYYCARKSELIEKYKKSIVTKREYPELTREELLKLRIENMQRELEETRKK